MSDSKNSKGGALDVQHRLALLSRDEDNLIFVTLASPHIPVSSYVSCYPDD